METMADGRASAAACMLSPRSFTSRTPSSKLRARAPRLGAVPQAARVMASRAATAQLCRRGSRRSAQTAANASATAQEIGRFGGRWRQFASAELRHAGTHRPTTAHACCRPARGAAVGCAPRRPARAPGANKVNSRSRRAGAGGRAAAAPARGSAPDRARECECGVFAQAQPARDVRRQDRVLRRTAGTNCMQGALRLSAEPCHNSRPAARSVSKEEGAVSTPLTRWVQVFRGFGLHRSRGPLHPLQQDPGWPRRGHGPAVRQVRLRAAPGRRLRARGGRGGWCAREGVGREPGPAAGRAPRPPPAAAAPPRPGWRRRLRAGSPPSSPAAPWGLRPAQGVLSTGSLAPPRFGARPRPAQVWRSASPRLHRQVM